PSAPAIRCAASIPVSCSWCCRWWCCWSCWGSIRSRCWIPRPRACTPASTGSALPCPTLFRPGRSQMVNDIMQLNPSHFVALLPRLIVGVTAMLVTLLIAWRREHDLTFILAAAGLNLPLLSLIPALQVTPSPFTGLMRIDSFALLYMGLILVATLACTTLVHAYLGKTNTGEGFPGNREEMYLLMLLAAAGGLVMVGASHLATLFIGLELLSVPVYGMVAYAFFNKRSLEAGIKYMVLSAAGSAFLLFGMALAYAESGSLAFAELGAVAVTPILQL